MKSVAVLFTFLLLFSGVAIAQSDWNSSPYNYKNSPYNYENSPYKSYNDRIIRDNQGRAKGYAVPKEDGGTNYYDLKGNRKGYKPRQN